jgi:ribosomal protein S18 acetylase RimI-like enzyme
MKCDRFVVTALPRRQASAEHNAKYLYLEVSHGNPAIELYRRSGFVDHQR